MTKTFIVLISQSFLAFLSLFYIEMNSKANIMTEDKDFKRLWNVLVLQNQSFICGMAKGNLAC